MLRWVAFPETQTIEGAADSDFHWKNHGYCFGGGECQWGLFFYLDYCFKQSIDILYELLWILNLGIMLLRVITLKGVLKGMCTVSYCFSGVLTFIDRTH